MGKTKILIVDDEPNILLLLESRLTNAGYAVVKAANGTDAVAMARKELPALIICDICLPDIDGGEVSHHLGKDIKTKDIPIIFLTALLKKEEGQKEQPPESEMHFLAKPFDPQELLDTIAKCLKKS